MNVLISGHRIQKLENYSLFYIKTAIRSCLAKLHEGCYVQGYSGMASGVDLFFCEACVDLRIPYVACPPFEGQEDTMSSEDKVARQKYLGSASTIMKVKNSWMVEKCQLAIIVWDGNKGGTHNVLQQMIENKKPFYWINPVSQKIWECL